jgi:hypothetical protein
MTSKRIGVCHVGGRSPHWADSTPPPWRGFFRPLPGAFCAPAAVAVQAIPGAAAASFATHLSFEPVFRSALFDVIMTFDKDPDLLRFFMCSSVRP